MPWVYIIVFHKSLWELCKIYNVQSQYIWLANYAHVLQWQYRAQNLKLACISFIHVMEHVLHVKFILFTLFSNWLFKVARFYLGVIFHRPQNWITLHKLSVAVAYIHRSRLATFLLSCLWKREQLPPIFLRLTTKRSNFADSVLQRIPQKCLFDSILRQMNESWKLHFILFCCWMRKFIHISPRKVVNDNLSYLFHIVFFLLLHHPPFISCQIGACSPSSGFSLLPPASVRVHVCRRVSQRVRVRVRIRRSSAARRAVWDCWVVCVGDTWQKDLYKSYLH